MTAADKPTISPSRLAMLSRCGMQYQFRYIDKIIAPPGVAMVIGTATHKAVEKNLISKRDTGALLAEEAVVECAADALRNTWDGERPALDDEEKAAGEKVVKGRAVDTAVAMSTLHHRRIAPAITPVHVERYFRLDLTAYPYDLDGFLDIQEPTKIRDTKTAAKSPSGDEADQSLQLTAYALAVRTIDGKAPESVHLDYLVKTKEPKAVTLDSTRCDDDYRRLLLRVERAIIVIEKGAFYPTSPDNWACSPRWCGWWTRCPWGAKQKTHSGFEDE